MGFKALTVDVERMTVDSPLKIVGKASASPGPLAIWRDNQYLTERESRTGCSPQPRRLDAVIVRDENQGSRSIAF